MAKTFKLRQKTGDFQLEFLFGSSLLSGDGAVTFESLFLEGPEVAVHVNINNEGWTVRYFALL